MNRGLKRIRAEVIKMKRTIDRPLIIGIAGCSGSGKTSKVAKKIREFFPHSKILSMDDYFKGRKFMDSIRSDNLDEPRAVDLELINKHLKDLKKRIAVQKPIYLFTEGERKGSEAFEPAEIIIMEGLFALHETVIDKVDLKIFVEISIHGSLLRRILRDVGRTGQGERDIFKQYVDNVYPMYKLHIEPTKPKADIVIVSQYMPEIESKKCESREVQIKVILNHKLSLKEIANIGFKIAKFDLKRRSTVFQEDTYYIAPNWESPYINELMRIRKEDSRYLLAYKGSMIGSQLRIRPKIEFEVEASLKDGLEKLGYKKMLTITKKREMHYNDDLELAIDEINDLGDFLEFRTSKPEIESKILDYLEKLTIDKALITRKSYLQLMLESKQSKNKTER